MSAKHIYRSSEPLDKRICLFSQRHLRKELSRCATFEFEDAVCEVDRVELLTLKASPVLAIGQKISNQLARHLSLACLNPTLDKQAVRKNYDLFVGCFQLPSDLLSLNAIRAWRKRCRTAVCWLEEIWAGELHKWTGHLKILSQFDHILISCSGSVKKVQDAIKRPCSYIPPGVDSIRFCPYPNPPARSIDVYYLGRRSPVTHQALLRMAEQRRIFYIYDTIHKMGTMYPQEHRSLIANIAKRSRYFFANSAKIDRQSETQGQNEIGYRFFEGAAAGTVMIGASPDSEPFNENFDWADAVIRIPFDEPNIAKVISELDSRPDRLEQIRRNNVVNSLLRHDWVYRWKAILDMAGLKPLPALTAREDKLKKLADMASKP